MTFEQWPLWLTRLLWSGLTLGSAYAIGLAINAALVPRLARLAGRTTVEWDDILISELKRRVPLWSVLIGLWLALGHWPLPPTETLLANRLLFIVGAASVTFAVARVVTRLVLSYGARLTPSVPVTSLTQNIARIVVTTLGLLVILDGLGVSITGMLTALGVGGLAVALALQEPLSNLFAGIFVTLSGQIRVGDYIKLDSGIEGQVADFNWRATRLRAVANNLVIVPNSKLAQAIVTNYSLPSRDLAIAIELVVDYDSDLARVEQVLLEVARQVIQEVPGAVADFVPAVRYQSLGDTGVKVAVGIGAREFGDQALLKHEFIKRMHVRFQGEEIVIATVPTGTTARRTAADDRQPPAGRL